MKFQLEVRSPISPLWSWSCWQAFVNTRNAMGPRRSAMFHQPLQRFREISQICHFLQLWHEPHCPYSELPIKCPRNDFKLPGELMSSADIVDEFAISHQTWAFEFLEGWQVRPLKSSVWSLPVLVVQTYQLHDVRKLNPELNFRTVALEKVGNAWILLPLAMLHILQMIQKAGYGDTLEDGPQSSWLGYSLLPEGFFLWSFTRHL